MGHTIFGMTIDRGKFDKDFSLFVTPMVYKTELMELTIKNVTVEGEISPFKQMKSSQTVNITEELYNKFKEITKSDKPFGEAIINHNEKQA